MTQLPNPQSQILTVSQAAKFLNVSIDTLRRWDKKSKLIPIRTAGGSRRYRRDQLEAFKLSGNASPDLSQMLTIKEAAQKFGVSAITLRRWDKAGKIKFVRDESNYRRISISEIKKFLGEDEEIVVVRGDQGDKGNQTDRGDQGYQVESVSRQINVQVTKYLLYAFAGIALIVIATGIQLTSTPWGKEFMSSLQGGVKNLSNVNQSASDQILGDEFLPVASSQLPVVSYSSNLLKNPSFETKGTVESLAFWQLHPNSTNDNTQMSNAASHSGSYSLLVTADTGGVIQESTKTEAGKNYQFGVWIKVQPSSQRPNQQPTTNNQKPSLHLALGPGWDKSFSIDSGSTAGMTGNDGWQFFSAAFSNPPPGLVPRIYVTANTGGFVFVDDVSLVEAESIANGTYRNLEEFRGAYLASSFQTLLPTGGNVLSVSPQGVIYPTDSSQTQGGLGTDSNRFGKVWGSNIDISQSLSVNEKVDISGKLTANGNIALGNNDGDELEIGGRFISDLLPKQSNAVSIGTSTQRWNNLFTATGNISNTLTVGGATTITGLLTVNGGLSASGGSGLSVTGDLALDGDLDFTGAQNITTTADNLTISPTGNLIVDTSGGTVSIRDSAIDLTNQPTTISGSTLTLRSTGSFILDTSISNTNLLVQTGTGDFNVNNNQLVVDGNGSLTLAPSNSQVTVTGNVDVSSGLDVTGTTTLGDGGTTNYLSISNTGDLTMNGTANNIIANNDLVIRSGNSLTLDTSASNNNLLVRTGSGTFDISAGAFTLTTSSYTQTTNGNINRTVAGNITDRITGANNYVLRVGNSASDSDANGNDIFISAVDKITLHSASFTQNTSGNTETIVSAGDYSVLVQGNNDLYLRGGGAGRDNVTDGGDLQLAAQDSMILDAGDITISASEDSTYPLIIKSSAGGIQLSTQSADNGNLSFYSAGTLTLDTSRNNTNVLILPGSGNVGIGSTAPGYKLDIVGSLGVLGDFTLNGDLDFTGAQNITTTADNLTLSPTGNLIIDTSGGTVYVRDAWEVSQTSQFSGDLTLAGVANQIIANNDFILTAAGSLSLDTSANNTNILIDSGTGGLTAQIGSGNIVAEDDATSALIFRASAGGIQLSSQSRDNGGILISSAGNLYIDTSFYGTTTYLQGGLVRVGSGGTANNVSGNGALYIQGGLEVDGSVWLGDISSDDLTLTGQIGSSLIPNVGSTYNLGSTTNRWAEGFIDTLTVTTLNSSANNISGITGSTFTIDTSNVSGDTEDISITFERGTPATNSQFLWDASEKYFSVNAGFTVSPDTDITTLSGENAILNVNDSYGGRRIASFQEKGATKAIIDSSGNILLYQSSNIETSAGTLTMRGYSGLTLTTSSATTGEIRVLARGTLQLDTSANNTNIVMTPGTGNIGIGSTAPVYKLDVNGTLRTSSTARVEGALTVTTGGASVTGDLTLDGDLDFTGPQNITTTADNLTLSPTGNLILDSSGGTVYVRDAWEVSQTSQFSGDLTLAGNANQVTANNDFILTAAGSLTLDTSANNTNINLRAGTGGLTGSFGTANLTAVTDSVSALYLNSQRGGITLSGSNAAGNGPIRILSGGSLQLSTSQGNQPIYLQAGTGGINLSSGTTTISGNVNLNSGILTLNGISYTFPGADGSASNVLTTSGAGLLSWGTLGAASITADSLDFAQFDDSLDLDADTSINGPYSFIIRTGNAARQNATAGNNDLQLAAEDAMILDADDFTLTTSNTGVSSLQLISKGVLRLDTSTNNNNILLSPGTGNVGIGTTGPGEKLHIYQSSGNPALKVETDSGAAFLTLDAGASGDAQINFQEAGTTYWYLYNDGGASARNLYLERATGTGNILIPSGNLGLGTTSPGGILDVLGQCVTGDTVLKRRRRRRRRGKNGDPASAEGFGEAQWEDIRIDEIKEGDIILTLDEITGRLVPQKVLKLMNKDKQEVYELITESGKHIQTTANHPYFVDLSQKMTISNMEYLQKETYEYAESLGKKYYVKFLAGKEIYCPSLKETVAFTHSGWNHFVEKDRTLNELITRFFCLPRALVTLAMPAKFIGYKKKEKKDMVVEYWEYQQIVDHVRVRAIVCAINGGKKFFLSCNWLGTVEEVGVKSNEKELSLSPSPKKSKLGRRRELVIPQLLTRITIPRSVKWVKVVNLKPGQRIATIDGWERVASIKKIGRKQTWDIEVEGTHNFVGNGIVAHNTSGLLMRAGASSLQLSSSATSTTADIELAAADRIDLFASSMALSTSSATAGSLQLVSKGSLILDTSSNNTNIRLQAGSGNINLSSGTTTISGNVNLNSGTLTLNGLAYTFPGTDSANGVLLSNGSGGLSWTTIGASSITADSLDFAQFQDELDLDADTTINGDYSLVIRSGLGSIQNSTSGNNDLQLSAEDKLILGAASFDLLTSSGGVDLISASYLDLSSKGTLTLDTSQNNSHIVLTPGTGNVGIGSTAPVYKLDVNGTLRTSSTARIEGALTVTTGGASVTGDLTLDGDLDFTGPQNITTTADNLTLSPTGNLIIDTSGGTLSIRDAAIDLTNQPTTLSASTLTLRSTGTFIIDTSANNTDIRLQAGSGNINLSSTGTITLTGNTSLNNGTLRLNGLTYTFPGVDSANGVLLSNGSGGLSWTTLGASSITADSLDFSEFKDELTLDADTSINGDYSLIVRAGLGAVQNSTSGNNDIQLAAEDRLDLFATSYSLTTSGNSIDMLSGGRIDLSAKGNLTLDTSQNNTNILLLPGTGNVGVGTTGPGAKLEVAAAEGGTNLILNDSTEPGRYKLSVTQVVTGGNIRWSFDQVNNNISYPNVLVFNQGNVGIGTTGPLAKVHLEQASSGTTYGGAQTGSAGMLLINSNNTNNTPIGLEFGGYTGYTFGGIYGLMTNAGNSTIGDITIATRNAGTDTSFTERLRITNTGNVGIGTTSPQGILDILGQCVARGTMIKRRKKRRGRKHAGKTGLLPENAGWDFEDVPIEEIEAGDEILSLDEHTGRFVVQRVKKLMDKGIKAIYELTTASGKTIKTTSEHPYLSIKGDLIQDKIFARRPVYLFIDETGMGNDKNQPYFGLGGLAIKDTIDINVKLHNIFEKLLSAYGGQKDGVEFKFSNITNDNKKFYHSILDVLFNTPCWQFNGIMINKDGKNWSPYSYWKRYLGNIIELANLFPGEKLNIVADYLSKPNVSVKKLTDILYKENIENILQLESQGSLLLQAADLLLGAIAFKMRGGTKQAKKEISDRIWKKLKTNKKDGYKVTLCRLDAAMALSPYHNKKNISPAVPLVKPPFAMSLGGADPVRAQHDAKLLAGSRWVKVKNLKVGDGVATVDGPASADGFGEVKWERITKIEKLRTEQVYDIEVEGTHNFVGNGIVAHNTTGILMRAGASSLQLSSSATSTTADIELAAADRIDLFAGSLSLQTSSTSAGDLKIISKGSLILDTSSSLGGTAPIIMNGNVGIGTTGPDAKLYIQQAANVVPEYNATGEALRLYLNTSTAGQGPALTFQTVQGTPLNIASIRAVKSEAATPNGGNLEFWLKDNSSGGFLQRVTFQQSGNVGIGTTAPGYPFVIQNSGTSVFQMKNGATVIGYIGEADQLVTGGSSTDFGIQAPNGFQIATGGTTARVTVLSTGNIGIGTTGPLGILDVIGNSSVLLRAGQSSLQLSGSAASTTADIQLAAADRIDLFAGSLSLQTSSTTAGDLKLLSKGSLILDTSSNNSNIILNPGTGNVIVTTGNVGIGTTGPGAKLDVLGLQSILIGSDYTGASGRTTNLAKQGALLMYPYDNAQQPFNVFFAENGATSNLIQIGGGDSGNTKNAATEISFFTAANTTTLKGTRRMTIDSSGNVGIGTTSPGGALDVAGAGAGILLRAGSASLQLSSSATSTTADLQLAAADRIDLFAGSLSLQTSSTSAGDLKLLSKGSLILDTSSNNSNIILNPGTGNVIVTTGNVGIGTTGPGAKLHVSGGNILIDNNYGYYSKTTTGTQFNLLYMDGSNNININRPTAVSGGAVQIFPGYSGGNIDFFNYAVSSINVRIQDNGNVGIGTTGPNAKLDVNGTINADGASALITFNDARGIGLSGTKLGFERGGSYFTGFDLLVGASSGMVIDSSGNVGIGTTGPTRPLSFANSTGEKISLYSQSAAARDYYGFGIESSVLAYQVPSGTKHVWYEGSSEVVRIQSGNVGIGTTGPTSLLHLVSTTNPTITLTGVSSVTTQLTSAISGEVSRVGTTSGHQFYVMVGGVNVLRLDETGPVGNTMTLKAGNVGIGTTGPGAKLDVNGQIISETGGVQVKGVTSHTVGLGIWRSNDTVQSLFIGNDDSNGSLPVIAANNADLRLGMDYSGTFYPYMTLQATTGNVGIGTTSPGGALDVAGDAGILLKAGAAAISLSSGTTSSSDLQLAAADRIDLFAGSLSLQTSSTSAGDLKIISKGSLILDTSSSLGGTAPIIMNGNVGIGTTAPGALLHTYSTGYASPLGMFGVSGTSGYLRVGGVDIIDDTSLPRIFGPIGENLYFGVTGDAVGAALTLKPGGNLGIGTTSPLQLLHVKRSTDGAPVRFEDSNGYCEIDPTTTTWTCTSDLRLKKDIVPVSSDLALEGLTKLQGVNFRWLEQAEGSSLRLGFVAQEVEKIFPELVRTDENGLKSVAYGGFTPYLVEAIKELNLRVGNLTDIDGSSDISRTREVDTTLIREVEERLSAVEEILLAGDFTLSGSYLDNEVNLGGGLISPLVETKLTLDVSSDTVQILGSATIGGNLIVGTTMIGEDGSINGLGCTIDIDSGSPRGEAGSGAGMTNECTSLRFQPLALGNIEFMGGKVTIDTKGNLKVAGEITAEKATVKELCVEDICVTRDQLKKLLEKNEIY